MYACTGRYRISMGVTGMAIVRAIVGGERDARQLAQLRDRRCHQSEEAIAEQLSGHWRADHLFTLGQALKMYAIQERIAEYEREIMEECRGQGRRNWTTRKRRRRSKSAGKNPCARRCTGSAGWTWPGSMRSVWKPSNWCSANMAQT